MMASLVAAVKGYLATLVSDSNARNPSWRRGAAICDLLFRVVRFGLLVSHLYINGNLPPLLDYVHNPEVGEDPSIRATTDTPRPEPFRGKIQHFVQNHPGREKQRGSSYAPEYGVSPTIQANEDPVGEFIRTMEEVTAPNPLAILLISRHHRPAGRRIQSSIPGAHRVGLLDRPGIWCPACRRWWNSIRWR